MPTNTPISTDHLLTFEQSIDYTADLLTRIDLNEITDRELQTSIEALIRTENGARGFFVSYLTGDWEIADHPTPAIVESLRTVPTPNAELLVKNLVMSTAMAIAHRRMGNETQAQGSDRVRDRTANLIMLVKLAEVSRIAALVKTAAESGIGEYNNFLTKWGYDREQRDAIAHRLEKI